MIPCVSTVNHRSRLSPSWQKSKLHFSGRPTLLKWRWKETFTGPCPHVNAWIWTLTYYALKKHVASASHLLWKAFLPLFLCGTYEISPYFGMEKWKGSMFFNVLNGVLRISVIYATWRENSYLLPINCWNISHFDRNVETWPLKVWNSPILSGIALSCVVTQADPLFFCCQKLYNCILSDEIVSQTHTHTHWA